MFLFLFTSCDNKVFIVQNNCVELNCNVRGGEVLSKINTNLNSANFPERNLDDSVYSLIKYSPDERDLKKLKIKNLNLGFVWEGFDNQKKIKKYEVCPLNLNIDGWYSISNLSINNQVWTVTFYMKKGKCVEYKYELVELSPI